MQIRLQSKKTMQRAILFYIVSILLVIDGGSMYLNTVGSMISNGMVKALLVLLCVLSLVFRRKVIRNGVYASICIIAYISVYMLATNYNTWLCLVYVIVFAALMLFFFDVIHFDELDLFLNTFSSVVVALAVISLFFWVFGSLLHLIPKRTIYYIWGREYAYVGYNYFFLYYENPVQAAGSIIRNTGIFTEAPGYVDRLIIALCIEMFYKREKITSFRVIVLLLAMLTTLSSKALILLIYMVGAKWFFYNKFNTKWKYFLHFFVVIVVGTIAVFLLNRIMQNEMATASSRWARYDHLQSGFRAFLDYPIFGVGYNNMDALAKYHLYRSTPKGASMGIATSLGEGGIYMFLLYIGSSICAYYSLSRNNRIRRKDYVLFLGAIFIEWFISNIGYLTMMMSLVCAGYAYAFSKRQKSSRKIMISGTQRMKVRTY